MAIQEKSLEADQKAQRPQTNTAEDGSPFSQRTAKLGPAGGKHLATHVDLVATQLASPNQTTTGVMDPGVAERLAVFP